MLTRRSQMYIRLLVSIVGVALALYTGYQSLVIAQAGAANEIPQLEGDGGGGVLYASICCMGALVSIVSPLFAIPIFLASVIISLVTGYIYLDSMLYVWAAGPLLLSIISYILYRKRPLAKRNRIPA